MVIVLAIAIAWATGTLAARWLGARLAERFAQRGNA